MKGIRIDDGDTNRRRALPLGYALSISFALLHLGKLVFGRIDRRLATAGRKRCGAGPRKRLRWPFRG
jgi:hypothetical protein